MDFVGKTISVLGALATLIGILTVIIPLFQLRRKDGLLAIALGFGFVMLGTQLSPELRADAAAKQNERKLAAIESERLAASQPVELTKRQMLANLSINNLMWEKGGFGSVMVATFMVQNKNPTRVKDIRVTCGLTANSGTVIDTATHTIYEAIDKKSYIYVRDVNMGFIDSQANRSTCMVTDFSVG